jgi:hypothetical protein
MHLSSHPTQPARAGLGMMSMTLLQLHHEDVRELAGDLRGSFARALRWSRALCRLMHRAIIAAKLRRLQSEPIWLEGYGDEEQDVAKYPQRPLILGDKWDF